MAARGKAAAVAAAIPRVLERGSMGVRVTVAKVEAVEAVGAEAAEHLLQTLLRIQERRARAHRARQGEPVGEDSCDRGLGSGGAGPSGALHELCARRRRLGGRSPFRADARFDAECTQRTRIASNRSQSRPRGMAPLSRGHSRVLQLLDGRGPGTPTIAEQRRPRYQYCVRGSVNT